MRFKPPPENDFLLFMQTYFERCCQRVPQIRAVAAKWTFEDLIPGLSDFDTRFILADPMTTDDWQAMSLAVGEVHAQMARQFPRWHRNLEHLPGVNMTIAEISNPQIFYPEFAQWTFYQGDADTITQVKSALKHVAWSACDELYHLKKIANFYGPYQRGIDPPINLGAWENKYPLHSRFMHYFAPPVQAAVSLVTRCNQPGKLEALRLAREMFPNPHVIDLLFSAVEHHYELSELYVEPGLTELERQLQAYLATMWTSLRDAVTLVQPSEGDDRDIVRAKVAAIPSEPLAAFFESAKFGRLLEGRLRFYHQQIPGFDSAWLIRNELGRIVNNFYEKPLKIFATIRWDQDMSPAEVLAKLQGNVLTCAQVEGMKDFHKVASRLIKKKQEHRHALEVAQVFGHVLSAMETLGSTLANDLDARSGGS